MGEAQFFYWKVKILILSCLVFFNLLGCTVAKEDIDDFSQVETTSLKLITQNEGFYEVSLKSLKQEGIDIDQKNIRDWVLYQRGSRAGYWIDNVAGETWIRFYSPPPSGRYSKETITIITRNDKIFERPGDPDKTDQNPRLETNEKGKYPGCFGEQFFENNVSYQPKAFPGEPWFWASINSPGEIEIPFTIKLLSDNPFYIHLNIWAATESDGSPDHQMTISLNGSEISEHEWDGRGSQEITASVKPGILINGKNKLTLRSTKLSGVIADKIWLDWFSIDQSVVLENIKDPIKIQCNVNFNLPIDSVVSLDVFHRIPGGQIERVNMSGERRGELTIKASHEYWFINRQDYRRPENVLSYSPNGLDGKLDQPAEYLVIGERDLLDAAKLLIEWRRAQGLKVTTIPVDFLYDQFNAGYAEPEAIRSFLFWISEHWPSLPKYVLLMGDASFDPQGYQSVQNKYYLPSFLVGTQYGGETASDFGYSIISSNPWPGQNQGNETVPQVAIGRLPARNPEQIKILVDKIINYEKQITRSVSNDKKVLVLADNQESSFHLEGKNFLQTFPQSFQKELFSPEPGSSTSGSKVIELWQAGFQWIAYFGHGSIQQWGSENLLASDMVEKMPDQPDPPIVLQFTCLSGLFTHPTVESLSEALLWKSKGGAIALFAPTSLTLPGDQSFLSQKIAEQLISSDNHRLGDVLLSAWQDTAELPVEINDVLRTFVLLGDPGLVLP
jgi:hypothetical protein